MAVRFMCRATVLFTAAVLALILLVRWVPPPTTMFMMLEKLKALREDLPDKTIHYEWVAQGPGSLCDGSSGNAVVQAKDFRSLREHSANGAAHFRCGGRGTNLFRHDAGSADKKTGRAFGGRPSQSPSVFRGKTFPLCEEEGRLDPAPDGASRRRVCSKILMACPQSPSFPAHRYGLQLCPSKRIRS